MPVMECILDYFYLLKPNKNCPIQNSINPISKKLYLDGNKVRIILTQVDYLY